MQPKNKPVTKTIADIISDDGFIVKNNTLKINAISYFIDQYIINYKLHIFLVLSIRRILIVLKLYTNDFSTGIYLVNLTTKYLKALKLQLMSLTHKYVFTRHKWNINNVFLKLRNYHISSLSIIEQQENFL